jgi:DNA-binding FadR family transcriptional regulator
VLAPVQRRSLSDAVFGQLRDQIVSGAMPPGSPLPAERVLCDVLGVNRGAVREALRRLEQARLVSVHHGGTSRVLDYRLNAGMDLLADLILGESGALDTGVVRGIVEMRSALAPDVARLAARRAAPAVADALDGVVSAMREARGDLQALQRLSQEFWAHLVEGCGNLAYRLAFNTLREVYERSWELLRPLLADELEDLASYTALAAALRARDERGAERRARSLVRRGETRIAAALERIDAHGRTRSDAGHDARHDARKGRTRR